MLSGRNASLPQLRFDEDLRGHVLPRMRIVWLENTLDCRTWTYYCDLKDAMARMHDLCTPRGPSTCVDGRRRFDPQLIVAGPRYMANVAHADETLGFDRSRFAHLPLAVIQNKMYAASTREIVGDSDAKLRWARAAGASVGFTWLPTQHVDFTARSGIPHHKLPFGVNAALYGRHAGSLQEGVKQPYDIGFTGASSHKYPLRESILKLIRSLDVRSYLGTWQQTSLRLSDNRSWKALDRDGYVLQISKTKLWVSTTGPSNIVGTRYFEILASGTTMLLCNRAPQGAYDGLFEDGVHAVVFDGMDDLRAKILQYLADEAARRRIVAAAAELSLRIHTWDARARFITRATQAAIAQHDPKLPYYSRPSGALEPTEPYLRCIGGRVSTYFVEVQARRPLRRFTVDACARTCERKSTHFGVQCGGFCSGNGHRLARCYCSKVQLTNSVGREKDPNECATACSLNDPRPCGGWDAMALYALPGRANATAELASEALAPAHSRPVHSRQRPKGKQSAKGGVRGGRAGRRGAGGARRNETAAAALHRDASSGLSTGQLEGLRDEAKRSVAVAQERLIRLDALLERKRNSNVLNGK
jgi:hypothetical protein